jgi:hypothetical protein
MQAILALPLSGLGWGSHSTTSWYRKLDVRKMQRDGLLRSGGCATWRWSINGEECGAEDEWKERNLARTRSKVSALKSEGRLPTFDQIQKDIEEVLRKARESLQQNPLTSLGNADQDFDPIRRKECGTKDV